MTVLVLASQSPARLQTLRDAGIEPVVIVSGVDEDQLAGLPAAELAERLAVLKASAVAARPDVPEGALVLGCDSVLELAGESLGKPGTAAEATRRWRAMRGTEGTLITGHCLIDTVSGESISRAAYTTVRFAEIDDEEIEAYVATGEPLQVAGAFTIDGLGGGYVTGIEGDPHNVVGVSLPLVRELARQLGHQWHRLWAQRG